MANKRLVEDYQNYFQKEVGEAYGLKDDEIDILRGAYEKIAAKTAERIRGHIRDFYNAYEDYKEANDVSDGEIRRALNVEIRRYMIALRREAIANYVASCKAAIEEYDLTPKECKVIEKYWMARLGEMVGDLKKRFGEVSEHYTELVKRYDLQEEDIIDLVAAVVAANILL